MKFTAYILGERQFAEFEVTSKIKTDVHGHFTYSLRGVTENGTKASTVVNKSQWDKYDVPCEERFIEKIPDRKRKRNKSMQPVIGRSTPVPKGQRRVYDEEIEKWLASHYEIDIDNAQEYSE